VSLVALACAMAAIETPEDLPAVEASIKAIEADKTAAPAESTMPDGMTPSAKAWPEVNELPKGTSIHRSKPKKRKTASIHALLLNAVQKEKKSFEERLRAEPKGFQSQMDKLDNAAGLKAFDAEFAKLDGKADLVLDGKEFDHAFEKLNAAAERGESIHAFGTAVATKTSVDVRQATQTPTKKASMFPAKALHPGLVEHQVSYGKRNSADLFYLLIGVSILGAGVLARYKVRQNLTGAALPSMTHDTEYGSMVKSVANPAALEASFRQALGSTA